jgi:hypothetical protein
MKTLALKAIQDGRKVLISDCEEIDVDYDTLLSLHNQLLVRILKSEGIRRSDEYSLPSIIQRIDNGETLMEMSTCFGMGSYKLAKIYIEAMYGKSFHLSSIIDNPLLIEDINIRKDILECISEDPTCSPSSNLLKECVGKEFEDMLTDLLVSKKMCFETEADLRSRGKPKTPDILFLIPMATTTTLVKSPVVINWIDSKAMFADDETFKEHLDQLNGYNNRYGRGMVIYWLGYSDTITTKLIEDDDDMIVVTDCFPENWLFPTGNIPVFDKL